MDIVVCSLATWFVALMLVHSKQFRWLRERAGVGTMDLETGESIGTAARVLTCFWCTSAVVAVPMYLLYLVLQPAVLLLAIAGASSLLYNATRTYLMVER